MTQRKQVGGGNELVMHQTILLRHVFYDEVRRRSPEVALVFGGLVLFNFLMVQRQRLHKPKNGYRRKIRVRGR